MASFPDQLRFIRRLQELARSLPESCSTVTPRTTIILSILARSTIASESVCVLFEAGLEPDAQSVARTIAELAIDLRWILDVPGNERIVQFVEYGHLLNRKRENSIAILSKISGYEADRERAFAPASGTLASSFPTAEAFEAFKTAEYERVKGNYPRKASWAGTDIAARAESVGLKVLYESTYRMGCESVHSGPATISGIVQQDSAGRLTYRFGSIPPQDDTALLIAAMPYIYVIELAIAALTPERRTELDGLGSDYVTLFGKSASPPGASQTHELNHGRE